MANANQTEPFWQKALLIVLDKGVLALVIAFAGFLFNSYLQEYQTQGTYQQKIFDQRLDAYLAVLKEAKHARGLLAVLYEVYDVQELGELGRMRELQGFDSRISSLLSGTTRGGFWGPYEMEGRIAQSLIRLEQIARDNDVYLSETVKAHIGTFLTTVMHDLEPRLRRQELRQKARESKQEQAETAHQSVALENKEAWQRAESAYRILRDTIRERLRIEQIVLG